MTAHYFSYRPLVAHTLPRHYPRLYLEGMSWTNIGVLVQSDLKLSLDVLMVMTR